MEIERNRRRGSRPLPGLTAIVLIGLTAIAPACLFRHKKEAPAHPPAAPAAAELPRAPVDPVFDEDSRGIASAARPSARPAAAAGAATRPLNAPVPTPNTRPLNAPGTVAAAAPARSAPGLEPPRRSPAPDPVPPVHDPKAAPADVPAADGAAAGIAKTSYSAKAPAARAEPDSSSTASLLRPAAAADDSLEALFQSYRDKFREASGHPPADAYAAIERADIEGKLIALFFLRDTKRLEDYRDLIRSFRDEEPVNVDVELLKAALYQKVGQPDLRDRALERISRAAGRASRFVVTGLAFAAEIRGYRSYTPTAASEFVPGQDLLLYGELEGFRSTPVEKAGAAPGHRRSFSAELVLRDGAGREIDRREFLRAGQAVEVVEAPAKPVHFWGRYALPARLTAGAYALEIEVQDIEGSARTRGSLALRIR